LLCTYLGEDRNRDFDILVDSQRVANQKTDGNQPGGFFNTAHPIPLSLTRGKSTVTVRFQANGNALAGGLFDLRVIAAASAAEFLGK
jgi:hypothetical protein